MTQTVAVEVIQDFQYSSTAEEMAVEQNLSEICAYERATTLNGVEQGIRFEKIKKIVGRKHWMNWVAAKCPFSLDTVERYMLLSKSFAQNPQIADFAPSAAYELAAGGDEAIAAAAELTESRGAITTKQAKEIRQSTVLGRDQHRRKRPFYADGGVVPPQAALGAGGVLGRDLIGYVGAIGEGEEAVSESPGHEQHPKAVRR